MNMFKGKPFAVFFSLLLRLCYQLVEIKSVSSGSCGAGILNRQESPNAAVEKCAGTSQLLWYGAVRRAHPLCC